MYVLDKHIGMSNVKKSSTFSRFTTGDDYKRQNSLLCKFLQPYVIQIHIFFSATTFLSSSPNKRTISPQTKRRRFKRNIRLPPQSLQMGEIGSSETSLTNNLRSLISHRSEGLGTTVSCILALFLSSR